jgi:hypothetical protein
MFSEVTCHWNTDILYIFNIQSNLYRLVTCHKWLHFVLMNTWPTLFNLATSLSWACLSFAFHAGTHFNLSMMATQKTSSLCTSPHKRKYLPCLFVTCPSCSPFVINVNNISNYYFIPSPKFYLLTEQHHDVKIIWSFINTIVWCVWNEKS